MTKHKVHEAKNALNFIAQLYSVLMVGGVWGGCREGGVSDENEQSEAGVSGQRLQRHR